MPRRVLKLAEKQCVFKCFSKFVENRGRTLSTTQIAETVAEIFSVSRSEVFKIFKTGYENLESSGVGKNIKTQKFLDFNFRKDLQFKIWELNKNNEYFTLNSLLTFAKEELNYEGSRATLHRVIKSMGYKFKMVNGRKILCEQKHVITQKIRFLRKFLQYKNSPDNVYFVFVDETWIFQNGSRIRRWVHDTDIKSNPSKIKSEGKRFTILHAGGSLGFLEGCDYMLDSKTDERDYHKTMNADLFRNWVEKQLLPALNKQDRKCVVVLDNAPYHSVRINKPPTSASKKEIMQEWLTQQNVAFDRDMTKKQLYSLIKPIATLSPKSYAIDELLRRNGHEVLRLPPYHCEYNPIEMAWGFCKNFYNKHINSEPKSKHKVANLWLKSISLCTGEMWANYVRRCEKLIEDDWCKYMGSASFENIPPVIISLAESDSETEDEIDFLHFDEGETEGETEHSADDPSTMSSSL